MNRFGPDRNRNGEADIFDHIMNTEVMSDTDFTSAQKTKDDESRINGISIGGKQFYDADKDSSGMTIFKSFLVTALCIGGIVFPIWAGIDGLGLALCPLGAVALSVMILKNT